MTNKEKLGLIKTARENLFELKKVEGEDIAGFIAIHDNQLYKLQRYYEDIEKNMASIMAGIYKQKGFKTSIKDSFTKI